MRYMMIVFFSFLLMACSTPPEPPTVDGSDRQPINSAATIAKLTLMAEQGQNKNVKAIAIPFKTPSKTVSVIFANNNVEFSPTSSEKFEISELIATAKHIEIRGLSAAKTASDSLAISIAKKRAINTGLFLINNGAKSSQISLEYKAIPTTKKDSFQKVEIEFFTQA